MIIVYFYKNFHCFSLGHAYFCNCSTVFTFPQGEDVKYILNSCNLSISIRFCLFLSMVQSVNLVNIEIFLNTHDFVTEI
jgi:hypothetical protein